MAARGPPRPRERIRADARGPRLLAVLPPAAPLGGAVRPVLQLLARPGALRGLFETNLAHGGWGSGAPARTGERLARRGRERDLPFRVPPPDASGAFSPPGSFFFPLAGRAA